jgi:HSP20 family protein
MEIARWKGMAIDPLLEFNTLQEEINRLFEGSRPPGPHGIFERSFSPAIDVVENPGSYGILCDLPGVDLKDVEISVTGSIVTLKGEKRRTAERGDRRDFHGEFSHGKFQRTVQLPLAIDADKVEAVLKDGVLRIILPKREELKPRQISVRTS